MLNIGDVIILEDLESKEVKRYKSKIVEKKEDELYIDYPFDESTGKAAFLPQYKQLKAYIVSKDNIVYTFYMTIKGRKKIEIPVLVIDYPGEDQLTKTQRRRFVRVPSTVDVAIHPLYEDFTPFTATTLDISAGGIAINAPVDRQFTIGKTVMIWLVLHFDGEESQYIKSKAHIIRVIDEIIDNKQKISLEFDGLTALQRQTLIKFSFNQQLLFRRKGMEQY